MVEANLVEKWNEAITVFRLKTSAVDYRKHFEKFFKGMLCHFGDGLQLRKVFLQNHS
jgi:hypothetical protein